jgi:hypothetical protein
MTGQFETPRKKQKRNQTTTLNDYKANVQYEVKSNGEHLLDIIDHEEYLLNIIKFANNNHVDLVQIYEYEQEIDMIHQQTDSWTCHSKGPIRPICCSTSAKTVANKSTTTDADSDK